MKAKVEQETLFRAPDFGVTWFTAEKGCGDDHFPCRYELWVDGISGPGVAEPGTCTHESFCLANWRKKHRNRFPDGFDPQAMGYLDGKVMPDGRGWCLMPLTLGRLRIVIVEDHMSPGEHWCYSDVKAAVECYTRGWEHEPEGWSRHMCPDGTMEYPETKVKLRFPRETEATMWDGDGG